MAKELTAEDLQKAETMPIQELLALASAPEEEKPEEKKEEPPRDEKGRFVAKDGEQDGENAPAEEPEPEEQIFRKVIANDDGTTDVYEASSIEELIDKIAEGKRAAVAQMKKVQEEKRALESKTQQESKDEEYVMSERFKKEPLKVLEEMIEKREAKREEVAKRSNDVQSRFVNTHPDYVATPENGNRLVAEFRRLNPSANEFTSEGLEKAYLSLKKDGLIQLKPEASGTTEAEGEVIPRTEEPKLEATQPRSPRSSTISTRSGSQPKPVKPAFNEDEAYGLSLDELRQRASAQLAEQQRQ